MSSVVRRREPCRDHFEITLAVDHFPEAQPGQFIQVLCRPASRVRESRNGHESDIAGTDYPAQRREDWRGTMLRRPFSLAGVRRAGARCEVDLIGRVVGQGTSWLSRRSEGDRVELLGPLGRAFSRPPKGSRVLLAAGGAGLPPIRWMGEKLRENGIFCQAILGARTRELLPVKWAAKASSQGAASPCVEDFARAGIETTITTDDGTCGARGLVTDRMREYLAELNDPEGVWAYACGPEGMLKTAASLCAEHGVRCEVALERTMACGMGTCQSCVVRVVDESCDQGWRYALCCQDGPVFDAGRVIWP